MKTPRKVKNTGTRCEQVFADEDFSPYQCNHPATVVMRWLKDGVGPEERQLLCSECTSMYLLNPPLDEVEDAVFRSTTFAALSRIRPGEVQ